MKNRFPFPVLLILSSTCLASNIDPLLPKPTIPPMKIYDRLSNAFVDVNRANNRLAELRSDLDDAKKKIKGTCRESRIGRIWDEWFNSSCTTAVAQKETTEDEITLEALKVQVMAQMLVQATIGAFGLTPEKISTAQTGPNPFPSWNPTFSEATQNAYGSMNPRHGIRIFLRPFLTDRDSEGNFDGGPERLALTIFHETVHWLEYAEAYEAGLIMTPYLIRMSEHHAYRKEAALASDLNTQLTNLGFPLIFDAKMISDLKTKADKSLQAAKYVLKHYPQALSEDDLPSRLRIRELRETVNAAKSSEPDSLETLKQKGSLLFLDTWKKFESEIMRDIKSNEKEVRERRAAETQRRQDQLRYADLLSRFSQTIIAACGSNGRVINLDSAFLDTLNRELTTRPELKNQVIKYLENSDTVHSEAISRCSANAVKSLPDYPNIGDFRISTDWLRNTSRRPPTVEIRRSPIPTPIPRRTGPPVSAAQPTRTPPRRSPTPVYTEPRPNDPASPVQPPTVRDCLREEGRRCIKWR